MARREPRGLDPYERALLAGPQEKAAEGDEDAPPPLPRKLGIGNLRVGALGLLAFFALIVLVSVTRAEGDARPLLEPDCDRPQLALTPVEVQQYRPVTWTYAGPDGRYVVTVDAQEVGRTTTGFGGRTAQQVREWGPVTGCAVTGTFGVQVEPGRHVLQVWRAVRDCDANRAGCPLAELVAYAPFDVVPER